MSDPPTKISHTFPHAHRLRLQADFAAVFAARRVRTSGPLRLHGKPNGLTHCRLGLNVPRRVGPAVRRNRVKRMLREAYRLNRHDWPTGYDLVAVVNPHGSLTLADYTRHLGEALRRIAETRSER